MYSRNIYASGSTGNGLTAVVTGGSLDTGGIVTGGGSTETRPVNVAVTFCQYNGFSSAANTNVSLTAVTTTDDIGVGSMNATAPNPGTYIGAAGFVVVGNNAQATGWGFMNFERSGATIGSITQNGTTGVLYNQASDRRLKENITETREGLQKLMQLPVRDFSFKSDPSHTIVTGFIAQDVNKVFPEAVAANGDNGETPLKDKTHPWSVDYGRVTPLIVKAVQEIATLSETFRHSLTAWFASAENGIHDLFVAHLHATTVDAVDVHVARKICVGQTGFETCLTADQVEGLLKLKAAHDNLARETTLLKAANDNLTRRLDALEKKPAGR